MPDPTRRSLFALAGGVVAGTPLVVPPWASTAPTVREQPVPDRVFALGVASGDPLPDAVVIWTRLAPSPLEPDGGMPARDVRVGWQVATDAGFRDVVRSGTAVASPRHAHAVHVDVRGLQPARHYWYRFSAGRQLSRVGRTRTAPPAGSPLAAASLLVASCQNRQDGYHTAWAAAAHEDVDLVLFLGDAVYESVKHHGYVRRHSGMREPQTLAEYRMRHGHYRTDGQLQAAHAAHPFVMTPDDHEVDDNWAGGVPKDPDRQPAAAFRRRRDAAMRAYAEHVPARGVPSGRRRERYHRRLELGDLARLTVLDTRQYRSDQPHTLRAAERPGPTMTGAAQEEWALRGVTAGDRRWQLLGNQTMLAQTDRLVGRRESYDFDSWDGARVQRRRVLDTVGRAGVEGFVVLTGDWHATWACDLRPDFDDERSPVVGSELVATSISSGGDPDVDRFLEFYRPIQRESPHWRFLDNQRGYLRVDVGPDVLRATLRAATTVVTRGGRVEDSARLVVERDRPGVHVESYRRVAVHHRRPPVGPAGPLKLQDCRAPVVN